MFSSIRIAAAFLSFACALCAMAWAAGSSEPGGESLGDLLEQITGRQTIRVMIKDATGAEMGGSELRYMQRAPIAAGIDAQQAGRFVGWSSFASYDSLPPVDAPGSLSLYEGPNVIYAPQGHFLAGALVRMPFATAGCSSPLFPLGNFYYVELPDGGMVLALVYVDGTSPGPYEVTAKLGDQTYTLAPVPAVQAARLMMQGGPPDLVAIREPVSLVDVCACLAVAAAGDPAAQREALLYDLQACDKLLQFYAAKNSGYPLAPPQMLGKKPDEIARLPMNPFDLDKSIFEKPKDRDDGFIVYIPQPAEDGQGAEGYWLGLVLGDESTEPPVPLPPGVKAPPVAQWIHRAGSAAP